jgi:hypothetical protein
MILDSGNEMGVPWGLPAGIFQSSLRDFSSVESLPRTASWAKFSRPYGTRFKLALMGLRPVLLGPCTPWRTWGTRPGRRASFFTQGLELLSSSSPGSGSDVNVSQEVTGSAAKEAVEQDGKNDGADQDVNLVLLGRKTIDAISDTHDRGRDQKQNAQADDAATVAVTNAFEDRRQPVSGTGNSVKMTVIGLYSVRLP